MNNSLSTFLSSKRVPIREGHIQQCNEEVHRLVRLIDTFQIKTVLEIGFNAGHSSEVFLSSGVREMVSFDFGHHPCVAAGKEWIDTQYPERHVLILGDSTKTVPAYACHQKFDLIFVDGGHFYDTVMKDLTNVQSFAHANTIVAVDDVVRTTDWQRSYTIGPTRAWKEWVGTGKITELGAEEYGEGRGLAWGTFTHF